MILNSNTLFAGSRPVAQILINDTATLPLPKLTTATYSSFPNLGRTPDFYPLMYVYESENIVFLIENNFYTPRNYYKMLRIVETFNDVYEWYYFYTGLRPYNYITYNNKLVIATVSATCGAGCGQIASTGIEIEKGWWNSVYVNNLITLNNNLYDHTLFYEFGRNFWFSWTTLEAPVPVWDTFMGGAFAIFMRFITMEKTGVRGAPFNQAVPLVTFNQSMTGLMTTYLNGSYNFDNTFKIDQGVPNAYDLGGSDLMASMLYDLRSKLGETWLNNIWKISHTKPGAATMNDVIYNFITSCSDAVNLNLTNLFENYYRWPVSAAAKTYMSGRTNYIVP
jgi:hypothetical protein